MVLEKSWWTYIDNPDQLVQVDWNHGINVVYGWNEACLSLSQQKMQRCVVYY